MARGLHYTAYCGCLGHDLGGEVRAGVSQCASGEQTLNNIVRDDAGHGLASDCWADNDALHTNKYLYRLVCLWAGVRSQVRPIPLLRVSPTKNLGARFGERHFCHGLNLRVPSRGSLQRSKIQLLNRTYGNRASSDNDDNKKNICYYYFFIIIISAGHCSSEKWSKHTRLQAMFLTYSI